MSTLRDRLRQIVRPNGASGASECAPATNSVSPPSSVDRTCGLEQTLGGSMWNGGSFVVERRFAPEAAYGRRTIGHIAGQLQTFAAELAFLDGRVRPRLPLLFFDLETTGLSGGAGTYAFLIGCGGFAADGAFVTRQHLLIDHALEPAMLRAAAEDTAEAGTLVSFNGKSFDAPVLDTRYALHRQTWPRLDLPHLDILHPSRRFWAERQIPESADGGRCSLLALEEKILGVVRRGDVPGFEIPSRYFQFLRSGDAAPLGAVLEHNRLDLVSLAGLAGRLLELLARGPGDESTFDEALALGHFYERGGACARSLDAFRFAAKREAPRRTRIDALRRLGLALRRARRYDDAASCWRQVLEIPACPRRVVREANEALAIHHEHRVRDLDAARRFALLSLEAEENRAWKDAVRHRLARLDRKMASGPLTPFSTASSPSTPGRPSSGWPTSARRTSS